MKSQSRRKPAPQCGQLVRWKRLSRMAARRSGRRSALRLCTVSNESSLAQEGQSITVSLKSDMWFSPSQDVCDSAFSLASHFDAGCEGLSFCMWYAAYSSANHSAGARNW